MGGISRDRYPLVAGIAGLALALALVVAADRRSDRDPRRPPIVVTGESVAERVRSAVRQVSEHYPNFRVEVDFVSREHVMVMSGWRRPSLSAEADGYIDEVTRRVADYREATVALLQAVARSNPSIRFLGAYEEKLIVPIWSRRQVLAAGPPERYRAFDEFSRFQGAAERQAGNSVFGRG